MVFFFETIVLPSSSITLCKYLLAQIMDLVILLINLMYTNGEAQVCLVFLFPIKLGGVRAFCLEAQANAINSLMLKQSSLLIGLSHTKLSQIAA